MLLRGCFYHSCSDLNVDLNAVFSRASFVSLWKAAELMFFFSYLSSTHFDFVQG